MSARSGRRPLENPADGAAAAGRETGVADFRPRPPFFHQAQVRARNKKVPKGGLDRLSLRDHAIGLCGAGFPTTPIESITDYRDQLREFHGFAVSGALQRVHSAVPVCVQYRSYFGLSTAATNSFTAFCASSCAWGSAAIVVPRSTHGSL